MFFLIQEIFWYRITSLFCWLFCCLSCVWSCAAILVEEQVTQCSINKRLLHSCSSSLFAAHLKRNIYRNVATVGEAAPAQKHFSWHMWTEPIRGPQLEMKMDYSKWQCESWGHVKQPLSQMLLINEAHGWTSLRLPRALVICNKVFSSSLQT